MTTAKTKLSNLDPLLRFKNLESVMCSQNQIDSSIKKMTPIERLICRNTPLTDHEPFTDTCQKCWINKRVF
jgi:hypothetical protein